jgi:SAM-dependent MidA family methyltransferase
MTLLSPEEEQHSRSVAAMIRGRIAQAGGWIPFDQFMELALYAPGLGYYSAGGVKLGAGGDFTTAPEISDLFSACVAGQCAEVLAAGGSSVLELGAGTGRMAAAILETLARLGSLPEHYLILEVSADLRARQQQTLARLARELYARVVWLDHLPERRIDGAILANEVLDALPCERFALRGAGIRELGVAVGTGGKFVEREEPANASLIAAVEDVRASLPAPLPDGYRSELCTRVAPWIAAIAQCLERGALLLFDYGLPRADYYHPQRSAGTLRCHIKQRAHDDPLINVGAQDITAWVDFTRVAEAGDAAGLEVCGFSTQTAFLLGAGIGRFLEEASDNVMRARRASEARRLMMPGEMGEAFKALVMVKGAVPALSGFEVQDLRRLL